MERDKINLRVARANVKGEDWSLFRVWLHSSYGKFEHYGEVELPKQLKYINDQVACFGKRA